MNISSEQIVAMAVAAIAEETQEDINHLRVISFRAIKKNLLDEYLAKYAMEYKKYQLGDEIDE